MYKFIYNNKPVNLRNFIIAGMTILSVTSVSAQELKTLKGQFFYQKGKPIAAAVINIAEESRIVGYEKNGCFSRKIVQKNDELCISGLG